MATKTKRTRITRSKTKVGDKWMPEAPRMEDIVRRLSNGQYFIGHDGTFGPLDKSQMGIPTKGTTELKHRNWKPERISGEVQPVNVSEMQDMLGRLGPEFNKDAVEAELLKPVSEMITTSQGAMDLLDKVRIDIDNGLADAPVLYTPLYERLNGPFPGGAVQIGGDVLFDAHIVFQQKMEAGEIVFGTLAKAGAPTFVPISTYAAGFEWTEDMIEFDRSYEIGMNARAFGRSYNYLLNHIHFSPILAYSYTSANQTPADATGGLSETALTLKTFQNAYRTAAMVVPQRVPSVILANSADRFQIEDALLTPVIDADGNPMRRVPVDTIIYYDGATVTNGVKSYVYPGVTAGKCYFIMPRQRMRELVHHDLRIDIGPADISRLVEGQQVGRARRGLYLDIANSVEEVTLP